MNFFAVISEMESKIEALNKDRVNYEDEKQLLERRLAEVNDLLSPIATDIEGLEMAVESLRSTSFAQLEPCEVIAEEPVAKEDEQSLEAKPAKPHKTRSKPLHINKYDQYGMLKKRYGSVKEAMVGLRWGRNRVLETLLMDQTIQLSRNGFYISKI